MSLFSRLRAALLPTGETDPEVQEAKRARTAQRSRANDAAWDPQAEREVALVLARKGRKAEAIADLQNLLCSVEQRVVFDFPECSPAELRAAAAMGRWELLMTAAHVLGSTPAGMACDLIGHAWRLVGLRLDKASSAEIMANSKRPAWERALRNPAPSELVDWCVNYKPLVSEKDAARFGADLYARLQIDAAEQLDAGWTERRAAELKRLR